MTPPFWPIGNQASKVVVIDRFKDKSKNIDIDNDGVNDLTHGQLASKCITAENKDVFVKEKSADKKKDGSFSIGKLNRKLSQVAMALNFGSKIEGVSISLSRNISYADLSARTEIEDLSPENVNENKLDIKEGLEDLNETKYRDLKKEFKASNKDGDTFELSRKDFHKVKKENKTFEKVVDNIEKITEKGVPVYIAAGNQGDSRYNLFTLAEGSTSVGATDKEGKVAYYSANNSDVDRYENGEFQAVPVFEGDESSKLLGYDINNDGVVDIDASELSLKGEKPEVITFEGTSFATPTALAKDLKEIEQ